ncbi:MAG TPA: hypothetical protein VFH63_08280, partial [candidate division Zixibacteria bacterium]|nr:hypothetical protein [candidate division Zixibacteria bacterium]
MRTPARRSPAPRWGEPPPSLVTRLVRRLRAVAGERPSSGLRSLPPLPVALQRSELAAPYLEADRAGDHRRAGV